MKKLLLLSTFLYSYSFAMYIDPDTHLATDKLIHEMELVGLKPKVSKKYQDKDPHHVLNIHKLLQRKCFKSDVNANKNLAPSKFHPTYEQSIAFNEYNYSQRKGMEPRENNPQADSILCGGVEANMNKRLYSLQQFLKKYSTRKIHFCMADEEMEVLDKEIINRKENQEILGNTSINWETANAKINWTELCVKNLVVKKILSKEYYIISDSSYASKMEGIVQGAAGEGYRCLGVSSTRHPEETWERQLLAFKYHEWPALKENSELQVIAFAQDEWNMSIARPIDALAKKLYPDEFKK